MGGLDNGDPLAFITAPPPDETPEQRMVREANEMKAQEVSDRIDDQIKVDKAALKKGKGIVKVLLLGQSESGT